MRKSVYGAAASIAALLGGCGLAHAQASPRSPLLDLSKEALRGELDTRYQAALQMTLAPDVRRSEDSRFIWASEAKVQCGIAIGYLKTGTKDPESIDRCDALSARLQGAPATVAPPSPPAPEVACAVPPVVSIFFDWNVDTPPADADAIVQQVAAGRAGCGWSRLEVVGHADRSGSDDYNIGLSNRRAGNVVALLEGAGVPRGDMTVEGRGESQLKVETMDGVREPMNRRVEITAIAGGQ